MRDLRYWANCVLLLILPLSRRDRLILLPLPGHAMSLAYANKIVPSKVEGSQPLSGSPVFSSERSSGD